MRFCSVRIFEGKGAECEGEVSVYPGPAISAPSSRRYTHTLSLAEFACSGAGIALIGEYIHRLVMLPDYFKT